MCDVTITWIAVLDDGTRPFAPEIQRDQRRPLSLVASEDVTIDVTVISPVGGLIVLGLGEFLVFTARTGSRPTRQLFSIRSTPSAQRHRFSIAGNMTKALLPQRGSFDVWAIRGSGRSTLIPLSELIIAPSALGNNYL